MVSCPPAPPPSPAQPGAATHHSTSTIPTHVYPLYYIVCIKRNTSISIYIYISTYLYLYLHYLQVEQLASIYTPDLVIFQFSMKSVLPPSMAHCAVT